MNLVSSILFYGGKILKKTLVIILIISISLSLLMISIEMNSYNLKYYLKSYKKYNIEDTTGKSMDELSSISKKIILYLKNKGGEELLIPQFNEREVLHMKDVQVLFNYARYVKYIGIFISVLILIYLFRKKACILIGRSLTFGLFSNYILFGILGILSRSNFNKYFTYFHEIFFTNDLWILDPSTDLMIQMLPEEFFVGMALNIGLSFLIMLAILQIVGCFLIKKGGNGNGKNISKGKGQINKEL